MDLSIVIVNWNTRALLERCLRSVFETVPDPVEVWVVDNASEDGSADMVAERFPQSRLIRNTANLGFAKANNQAIRLATGAHVLILNSDVQLLEGAVIGMVRHLQRRPEYGATACQLRYEDGSIQRSCRRFPTFLTLVTMHSALRYRAVGKRLLHRLHMNEWDQDSDRDVDQPQAACFLVRKDVLDQVGLFDEGCFLLYNDVDLCKRIRGAGYLISYLSSEHCIHTGSASLKKYKGLNREGLWNVGHYVRKHYGPWMLALFYLLIVLDALKTGTWRELMRGRTESKRN